MMYCLKKNRIFSDNCNFVSRALINTKVLTYNKRFPVIVFRNHFFLLKCCDTSKRRSLIKNLVCSKQIFRRKFLAGFIFGFRKSGW